MLGLAAWTKGQYGEETRVLTDECAYIHAYKYAGGTLRLAVHLESSVVFSWWQHFVTPCCRQKMGDDELVSSE